jgi:AcrR family transcriptional regulator
MKKIEQGGARARGRPRAFDREEALDRAMELFWRYGYEATSIADLTKAMGINPPSLYAAFGDKEKLFLEAIDRYCGDAAPAFGDEPTAREAVERLLVGAVAGLTRSKSPRGCMLVTSAMNCSESSAHLQDALARKRAAAERALEGRIERGVADGDLSKGTDTAALAKFYTTVLHGLSIQARDGASKKKLLGVVEAALRAWPDRNSRG